MGAFGESLARKLISELGLEASDLRLLAPDRLSLSRGDAKRIDEAVARLTGNQLLELTAASGSPYNSTDTQDALRALYIDLSKYNAKEGMYALAAASLLLQIARLLPLS